MSAVNIQVINAEKHALVRVGSMGIYAIAKNEDDVDAAENNQSITRSGEGSKSHPLRGVVCILDYGSDIIRSLSLLIYWK